MNDFSRTPMLILVIAGIKAGLAHSTPAMIAVCVFAAVVYGVSCFLEAEEDERKRKAREAELERIRTGRY